MTARFAQVGSRFYPGLLAGMAVIVILSSIGATKGVQFGPIITDGGFFLFPAAYLLGAIISEIYGFAAARRAILTSFALSILASVSYWVIIALPGFEDPESKEKQLALEATLGPVPIIVAASLLAFLAGQFVNTTVIVRLKERQGERGLWVRLLGSGGLGEFVDTVIFCTIAAGVIGLGNPLDGTLDVPGWLNYLVVGFVYKTVVQYLLIPVTSWVISLIKAREPSYVLAES